VINATGGGAYKYLNTIKENLDVDVQIHDEMRSMIKGLNFLLANTNNEIFTYTNNKQEFVSEGEYYPYLLCSVGSGVSILKVTGIDTFQRVSGSSLGGGTFWGLCRMLTNVGSFEEVKELVSQGDNKLTDLLVGDIYGGDYEELGLKADVVASSFGKAGTSIELPAAEPVAPHFNKQDIVKSLLFMLTINIAQIAYLNAKQHGVQRVFFLWRIC